MSEKPYQKPDDGVILKLKDRRTQNGPGVDVSNWVGTDLARFAQDVVALNARQQEAGPSTRCQVAPLESMQRGLKIKKPADAVQPETAPAVDLSRFRKE